MVKKNRNPGGAYKKVEKIQKQKRERKMKIKFIFAVAALAYAPLAVAGGKAAYPKENVAAFIVEKLDVTSLPLVYRPTKEKGKKTLADYGYTARKLEENEAIIEAEGGVKKLSIKVLDQTSSGIYACVAEPGQNAGEAKTQSVILLKRKDSNALLKVRDSSREFASCPAIGGTDNASTATEYGGD
jgi:hypothetical protein